MNISVDQQYLSIAQAATLLGVHQSTVRRWIEQGALPVYRIGERRVAVKRRDVAQMVQPAHLPCTARMATPLLDDRVIRPLTAEERTRALVAMATARELRAEQLRERGGKPFPSSWETLAEMRDERSRQLS